MVLGSFFFKHKAKLALKGNWQTALLVTFFASIFMTAAQVMQNMITREFSGVMASFMASYQALGGNLTPENPHYLETLDLARRVVEAVEGVSAATWAGLAIVYVLALGLVGGLIYIALPALVSAIADFVANVPMYYANVTGFLKQYMEPGGFLENFDIQGKVNELYAFVQQYLTVERILSYISSFARVTSSMVDGVLAIIVSVYMLLGRESLVRATKLVLGLVFKPKTMASLSLYGHKTAKIFYNYIYSQFLDALVVGVLATIGFLLARMPNAPVFGMLLGLMNMVPYFGALIGGVVSVLIMLLSGNFYGAVFIAIYIIVMQQIDANIIQPRIIGENVGIRPIYVLLGITVFGGLIGFWGIFLGAPFMAVIQLLVIDYIAYRKGTPTINE